MTRVIWKYINHYLKGVSRTERSLRNNINKCSQFTFRYTFFISSNYYLTTPCRTSLPKRSKRQGEGLKASLTVEAAIALPLMILAMWMLIFPLKSMEAERRLQNRMEGTARTLALAEYMRQTGEKLLKPDKDWQEVLEKTGGGLAEGFGMASILLSPETSLLEDLSFSEDTKILSREEGDDPAMIHAELQYALHMPGGVFSILPVMKSLVVHRRAWVGSAGGRGRSKYGPETEEEEEEDRIVYVGKNSTRYHEDPGCHYLANSMSTADASMIGSLRNKNGARYHACPSCKPGKSGTVYFFDNGTAYHSSESCRAITAYARAVHLKEVEHLGPCSYCGKK